MSRENTRKEDARCAKTDAAELETSKRHAHDTDEGEHADRV